MRPDCNPRIFWADEVSASLNLAVLDLNSLSQAGNRRNVVGNCTLSSSQELEPPPNPGRFNCYVATHPKFLKISLRRNLWQRSTGLLRSNPAQPNQT